MALSRLTDFLDKKGICIRNFFKFCCSSFASFALDYLVYSLILIWESNHINLLNLTFANITARVISSSFNFFINRKFVFKSNKNIQKSALQFFTLASIILFFNSIVLNFLANILHLNHYIAKIMTEMLFFVFNYTIQSFIIFKNKNPQKTDM